jgi:4-hydroxybenzoate polyprenyltransferase
VIAQRDIALACHKPSRAPGYDDRVVAVETEQGRLLAPQRNAPRGQLRALVAAARPLQWTKNLLVFAGVIFAAELDDPRRVAEAVLIFVSFSLASSAAYLVNDVRDAAEDREHPVKRLRPIASGELSPRLATGAAALLVLAALGIAAPAGLEAVGLVAAFVASQLAYTLWLKHVVLVDALTISWLFVLRAAAGAVGVDVRLSPWLVLCTGLLALFLALGKRRAELLLVSSDFAPGRPVLSGYSFALVDQLVAIVAAATISSYSIYTFTATDSAAMMLTIPFVVFGLFRYLYLMHQRALGEEPDRIALADPPIIATVVLWVTTAAIILIVV